ncbi:hypothetical protein AYI69_g3991 [Smittium culicis]|uniref:CCHC-type domain-containing protein n=1 Tax=Smittium culicis TaxID=133412 RepID=A0A1R1YHN4_9FUNG|nr:hypothetical protein AYI69_g3991 [Smittium culicis]
MTDPKPFIQLTSASISIPTYSGKGDDISFSRWYSISIDELKAFGFQNEEQMVLLMARQLKGNAKQVYDTLRDNSGQSSIKSLYEFKNHLESKFIDDNFDIKLRYRLLKLKQSGSISKYIEDEKNIFGNYKGMEEKDRIFYLMNNMKSVYLNILNKKNPSTFNDAINLLIQQGDVMNMNANMSTDAQKPLRNDDDMDIDYISIKSKEEEEIGINLVSIDQGGKTFWVTIKEKKQLVPLSTGNQVTRNFLESNRMCWNCGSNQHLRRDCKATDSHWRRRTNRNQTDNSKNIDQGKDQRQE